MDITGRDLNFFLKAFSAKDVASVDAGKLLESFEEEYEDKLVNGKPLTVRAGFGFSHFITCSNPFLR